ncbi:MAG TPA: (Fe-S)-binding protein [Ferrovibrio sp.]|jgi:L-lactate dehydrogenase complex protein LldE|uniref:(Fe-S)-binding protein n=1 Tax=Ferrovibrio sp. TaxID=1917215 RepID=UPI002B4B6F49|nr:(Fe-S)-binding protein [Ferrovibrio sp.]HLT76489.1 (Fe-S)-binding protein [Ferrovibrio sp.]
MTEPANRPAAGEDPRAGGRKPRVALFVTCLVDLFRPSVGFAAIKLMEDAGCLVEVPEAQVCCGQPAYNSGDRRDTTAIARQVIDAFRGYDYVVAPSGSCAGMIRDHYPALFAAEPDWKARAEDLSSRTWELTSFLVDVLKVDAVCAPALNAKVTYHDSCSGLRELGVKQQPRKLLESVGGVELVEMKTPETCCGFGGTFCVKYGEVSTDIVSRKTEDIRETGADLLLAGDMGCLLNMAGRLQREGSNVKARHVAEVLAGMTDVPPIGESDGGEA